MDLVFDIAQLQNLGSLHKHEEDLRAESLKLLAADARYSEMMFLIANAMGILFGFAHDHQARHDDELTLQYFGIRLFNNAGCALKLGLSGYTQQALVHMRDIIEVAFLLDYFRSFPQDISVWKASDWKERRDKFGPLPIRKALDTRDGNKEGKRQKAYKVLSEHATHVTYAGFRMTMNDGHGQVGPFVDERKLKAWMEELTLRLIPSAELFGSHFPDGKSEVVALFNGFRKQVLEWLARQSVKEPLNEAPRGE